MYFYLDKSVQLSKTYKSKETVAQRPSKHHNFLLAHLQVDFESYIVLYSENMKKPMQRRFDLKLKPSGYKIDTLASTAIRNFKIKYLIYYRSFQCSQSLSYKIFLKGLTRTNRLFPKCSATLLG